MPEMARCSSLFEQRHQIFTLEPIPPIEEIKITGSRPKIIVFGNISRKGLTFSYLAALEKGSVSKVNTVSHS